MNSLKRSLKRNPFIVEIYNAMLNLKCRSVEAYIFVATTGRSGTDSLGNIFEAADKAAYFHEPHPVMVQDIPSIRNPAAVYDKRFKKVKRIYIKRAASGNRYYLETNHQFVKTFAWPAVAEFGSKLKVIHLKRDPVSVAASFYRIDSIPGITRRGRHCLLDPLQEDNILSVPDLFGAGSEFNQPLCRCLWYWYEVEARIFQFKKQFPHVCIFEVTTEELNDEQKLTEMFNFLEIDFSPSSLRERVGTRTNVRSWEKKKTTDLTVVSEMNDRLLASLSKRCNMDFLSRAT